MRQYLETKTLGQVLSGSLPGRSGLYYARSRATLRVSCQGFFREVEILRIREY